MYVNILILLLSRKDAAVNMDGQFLVRQIYDDEITYNLISAAVNRLSMYTFYKSISYILFIIYFFFKKSNWGLIKIYLGFRANIITKRAEE